MTEVFGGFSDETLELCALLSRQDQVPTVGRIARAELEEDALHCILVRNHHRWGSLAVVYQLLEHGAQRVGDLLVLCVLDPGQVLFVDCLCLIEQVVFVV